MGFASGCLHDDRGLDALLAERGPRSEPALTFGDARGLDRRCSYAPQGSVRGGSHDVSAGR